MTPELAAMLRPLEIPRGIERCPAGDGLASVAAAHREELFAALLASGRDSAALLLVSNDAIVIAAASRGRVAKILRKLGDAAAAVAQRLEVRAPRGCYFAVAVDGTTATVVVLTTPGCEIEARGVA